MNSSQDTMMAIGGPAHGLRLDYTTTRTLVIPGAAVGDGFFQHLYRRATMTKVNRTQRGADSLDSPWQAQPGYTADVWVSDDLSMDSAYDMWVGMREINWR